MLIGYRYKAISQLGEGAGGAVWLAEDLLQPERQVAVKLLHPSESSERTLSRFHEEYRLLERLTHPNVVEVLEYGIDRSSGRPFAVLEYVRGTDILTTLDGSPPRRVFEALFQIGSALDFIHRRGFVHGDLKPAHILIAIDERLVLLDLGLAHAIRKGPGEAAAGTLPYVAPELLQGKPSDGRADLYSLGVILFQLLEKRLPFDGSTAAEIVRAHLSLDRPKVGTIGLRRHSWLVPAVERLLALEPDSRPPTAGALISEWGLALGIDLASRGSEALPYFSIPPLAGREKELAAIEQELTRVSQGSARCGGPLIVIEGPSGGGKSRLLREARVAARLRGFAVHESRAGELPDAPYGCWINILRTLGPSAHRLAGSARQLHSDCTAILAHGVASSSPEAASLPEPFSRLLRELSRQEPLLLMIDDFHRADAQSVRLLEHIMRVTEESPVLITLSCHAEGGGDEAAAIFERLEREGRLRRLSLARLSARDVESIVRDGLGIQAVAPEFIAALHQQSAGNPFFLKEALETLVQRGRLRLERGVWALPSEEDLLEAAPASIDQALERRLGHLSKAAADLARVLAVIGDGASLPIARRLLGFEEADFEQNLLPLVRASVILPLDQTPGRVTFAHGRLRDILYSQSDPEGRRSIHLRVASLIMDSDHEAEAEELAYHAWQSGDGALAMQACRKAATRARRLEAPAAAVRHLRTILPLLEDSDPARAETLLELAGCLIEAGDHDSAIEILSRLQVHPSLDPALLPRILGRRARALIMRYPGLPIGVEEAAKAVAAANEHGDVGTSITALKDIAVAMARQGRYLDALPRFQQALELLEHHPDSQTKAGVLNSIGLAHFFLGELDEAERRLHEAQTVAFETGLKHMLATTFHNLGLVHRRRGKWEAALEASGAAARLFHELGHRAHYGDTLFSLASAKRALGRSRDALDDYAQACIEMRKGGDSGRAAYVLDCQAEILRLCGRAKQAADLHREALALARQASDPVQEAYAFAGLARDQLDSGDSASARESAETGVLRADGLQSLRVRSSSALALATVDLSEGEYGPALASAQRVLELHGGDARLDELEVEANIIRARALAGQTDFSGSAKAAQEAIDRAESCHLLEEKARALSLLAFAHESAGRSATARQVRGNAASMVRHLASEIGDAELTRDYLAVRWRAALLDERPLQEDAASATAERRLEALYEIVASINSLLDPNPLLETVMDTAVSLVGAERGLLFLIDQASGAMEVKVARGVDRQTIVDATRYSRSIVREAGQGRAIIAVDADQDGRFRDFRSVSLLQIKSLMCVPLRLRDRVIGTVYLDSRRSGLGFSEEDLRFLEAFAHQAAIAIENARLHSELRMENEMLRRAAEERHSFGSLLGRSSAMRSIFALMERAADSNLAVLIEGESGTGKELVARALHFNGLRRTGPFVSQNCSAIPETLLESEIFGHVRGAFTGADRDRKGLFELAHKGSLFLDEIGDLPLGMQPKLLRVLQEGELRPIGGRRPLKVDVRIISATNRDLKTLTAKGRFREDLYYRLNVLRIAMPALRERREDIPLLIDHFLKKAAGERGVARLGIEEELLPLLMRYDWPGNIRELENAISRLALIGRGGRITRADMEADPELSRSVMAAVSMTQVDSLRDVERRQIQRALQETSGNRQQAAKLLGISKATIFRKIREYRID